MRTGRLGPTILAGPTKGFQPPPSSTSRGGRLEPTAQWPHELTSGWSSAETCEKPPGDGSVRCYRTALPHPARGECICAHPCLGAPRASQQYYGERRRKTMKGCDRGKRQYTKRRSPHGVPDTSALVGTLCSAHCSPKAKAAQ